MLDGQQQQQQQQQQEPARSIVPRPVRPVYYPIHYMEPITTNENAIDFDLLSCPHYEHAVRTAIETWEPTITGRARITNRTGSNYDIVLIHPGIPLSTDEPDRTSPTGDLALLVVHIPALLKRATKRLTGRAEVYIFDSTNGNDDAEAEFLGAVKIGKQEVNDDETNNNNNSGDFSLKGEGRDSSHNILLQNGMAHLEILGEGKTTLSDLRYHVMEREAVVEANDRKWTVVVVASESSFDPLVLFVILGGTILIASPLVIALWVFTNAKRVAKINEMKAVVQAQKAHLVVESARRATAAERELNDYIAHEVRNPVAAAMLACSFVKAAVNKREPLRDEASIESTREDVDIIDNSLQFVNDLLRNMLDMHRASNDQLTLAFEPVDVYRDILEPIDSMLYRRGSKFRVEIDSPQNLYVLTDKLRLKQVMLNLARNSSKFVSVIDKPGGFIRLRAGVTPNGFVQLVVEDSGPGIPVEKRDKLFCKFQESLDSLRQGTGIGLFLCKSLVNLMDGEIWLDTYYTSGVEGCIGTRFVVDLNVPPLDFEEAEESEKPQADELAKSNSQASRSDVVESELAVSPMSTPFLPASVKDDIDHDVQQGSQNIFTSKEAEDSLSKMPTLGVLSAGEDKATPRLPNELTVLFVDDDMIIRKLFARTVKKVAPNWTLHEASSGETALKLVETETFDLIFMDQYMTSIEKQLLGTETVAALRAKGVDARICGASANDVRDEFIQAGANDFMQKPFATSPGSLVQDLVRVLYGEPNLGDLSRSDAVTNGSSKEVKFKFPSKQMNGRGNTDPSSSGELNSPARALLSAPC